MAKTILIFGLPGSGKSTLASKLSQKLNADYFQETFEENEVSLHVKSEKLKKISKESSKDWVILDFIAPRWINRHVIDPDVSVFMDTVMTEIPQFEYPYLNDIDFRFTEYDSDAQSDLIADYLK